MRIILAHGMMFNTRTWDRAAQELAPEGIELEVWTHTTLDEWGPRMEADPPDLVIFGAGYDLTHFEAALEACRHAPQRVGLTPEAPEDFTTLAPEARDRLREYLAKPHQGNYLNGIRYAAAALGHPALPAPPVEVNTVGIYHPGADEPFMEAEPYLQWLSQSRGVKLDRNLVPVLFYYGSLVERNTADLDRLVLIMEQAGLAPMLIYTEGLGEANRPLRVRYPWLTLVQGAKSHLAAFCNYAAGRFLNRPEETHLLEDLNVPVFQLIRLWGVTPDQWREDPRGVPSQSLTYSVAQPEMAGVIEPMVVAAQSEGPGGMEQGHLRDNRPIPERMEALCRRIRRWMALRDIPNSLKRMTVVLNNPPCKGAEATVAAAVGLDAFESLAGLLQSLRAAGYDVGEAPESGAAIKELMVERKAFSEFRWTTVDEIVRKGGDIHRMGGDEYLTYLHGLPQAVSQKVLDDWDEFPGEGMVLKEEGRDPVLVITGLEFGKLKIMAQPKRGCYGAKCNGEVCRILHDPAISPPHHWLATYKYIRDNSDVIIHWGTHGALEFLPGKRAGLSDECFPDLTLEDVPNLYPYIMNVPGEGLLAKRRARAVLVDHLSPVYVPAPQDEQRLEAADLLEQYAKARDLEEGDRRQELQARIIPLLQELALVDKDYDGRDFARVADVSGRILETSRDSLCPLGMHVLGRAPDEEAKARMLASILAGNLARPNDDLPDPGPILEAEGIADDYQARVDLIQGLITGKRRVGPAGKELSDWSCRVADLLAASGRELPQLLRAMDGGYLEPGLAGSLNSGKIQTLPTGRNFYAMDPQALPTAAAWEVGRGVADELLAKYWSEEGRFPESVGQNLWSMDGFKSDGEILSQILFLMGVKPVWDSRGVCTGVKVISLEELSVEVDGAARQRPRVDVLVQTSGIVRDMLPNFLDLIDRAVSAVGDLDEPEDQNFILKHNRERMAELREDLGEGLGEEQMFKLAGCRVFSSPPGSYGIGVGLALDASAWENEADLAEVYVNWGGWAYAGGEYGAEARKVYAGHLKNLDVAYMKQYSPEYDLVDCGCYASYQGGMAQAARTIGGRGTKLYWSSNTASGATRVDDFADGLKAALGAKLFNPTWLEEIKKHGYQGAAEVSGRVNNLFKWSATSKEVGKEVFDGVVKRFLRDPETLEWLRRENPYALEELTRRLLEAESRGLWQADDADLAVVQAAALSVEGDLEETMGQVTEEFQGAKVEVMTAKDVDKWSPGWTLG